MRSVSEPICSRMGSRAGPSASGMCSAARLWKLLAGHLGRRAPKDLTAPRTWFTSCVRLPTNASRERIEQFRVHSSQASQVLGIYFICLAFVGIDEPQLAGIGHQDLVTTLLQEPANPGRVGSRFYGDAHRRLLGGEASSEGLWGCAQPALLHHLAAPCVDEAQVGVFVAEIQSGCHQWLHFATIHCGPILLPYWAF